MTTVFSSFVSPALRYIAGVAVRGMRYAGAVLFALSIITAQVAAKSVHAQPLPNGVRVQGADILMEYQHSATTSYVCVGILAARLREMVRRR